MKYIKTFEVNENSISDKTINIISKFIKNIIRETFEKSTISGWHIIFDGGRQGMKFKPNQNVKLPEDFDDFILVFDVKIKGKHGSLYQVKEINKRIKDLQNILLKIENLNDKNIELIIFDPSNFSMKLEFNIENFIKSRNNLFIDINT